MKHALITEQQLLKHALIAEQQLLKTGKWPRQWPFSGFRFSATCFRPDVSGYRVKRGMTYARASIKTGCPPYCNPGGRKSSFRRNAESSRRHPTLRMCSGYRVKRGMTYARTSTKTGCHHAIIQAVASRHYAPCHGVTLLQSRRSVVVITHRATVSPYCNPGSR